MATALITGASSGFGFETAIRLHKENYKLILVARRKDRLKELALKLGKNVYFKTVDVRDEKSIDHFFKEIPDEYKDIEVLINNAGGALGLDPVDSANIEDWNIMIDTNIKGVLNFTHKVVPIMKAAKKGYIINIGSTAGHSPYKGGNVYGACKAFVWQFSRNLRVDLFGTGIRVTCIEPGMAETEFSINRFKGDKEKAAAVYQGANPLKAADIADTILWLVKRPPHVNIDNIEIMPLDQTWAGLIVNRK